MPVTITGTLEMIYTVGADTVSEPVHVNFPSPTDLPLRLGTGLDFPLMNPPIDVRPALLAHLQERHGLVGIVSVTPRTYALAEWSAMRGTTPVRLVLWTSAPLFQLGTEWIDSSVTARTATVVANVNDMEVDVVDSVTGEVIRAIQPWGNSNVAGESGMLFRMVSPAYQDYVAWTFLRPIHHHDGRYYTEAEVDALLAAMKPMPPPARNAQNLSTTRSSTDTSDINFIDSTTAVTGLLPNTAYNIRVDVYLYMSTGSAGSFRPVVKMGSGGADFIAPITNAVSGIHDHSYGTLGIRTSTASGGISVMAAARWNSGSITSSRAEIILTVHGPA